MTNLGNAELNFTLDLSDLDRSLGRMSSSVKKAGDKAEKDLTESLRTGGATGGRVAGGSFQREFQRSTGGLGSKLRGTIATIGRGLGEGLGHSITGSLIGIVGGGIRAALDVGNLSNFDAASRKAATLTSDIAGLEKASFSLANELGNTVTATETLNSSYDVLSAGFSETADVMEILKASQKGAVGGFSDINTVANATTSVLNAYGLSASKAGDLVDQFAGTQNAGKLTINEYAENIGKVASVASAAGVSLEEVNAIIAASTVKGVRVTSAFDGLRAAISSTLKPSQEAADFAKKLGIEFDATALKTGGIVGILEDLEKAGASTPENLVKLFGSVEAVAAIAPIAGEGLEDYAKALDIVKNTNADEAFNKVAGGLEQQSKAFQNTLTDLDVALKSGAFGQAIASGLALANSALKQTIDFFAALSPEAQKFIGVSAAIGTALTALGVVIAGVSLAISAGLVASIGAAVAAAAPFVAIGAAIAGAIALVSTGIAKAIGWWDGLSDAQKRNVAENQPIQAIIGLTIELFRAFGRVVADALPHVLDFASLAASAIVEFGASLLRTFGLIIEGLNALIVLIVNAPRTFEEMRSRAISIFDLLRTGATQIFAQLGEAITGAAANLSNSVTQWFSEMVDRATAQLTEWVDAAKGRVSAMIGQFDLIREALSTLWRNWSETISNSIKSITGLGSSVKTMAGNAVSSFKSITGALDPAKKLLADIWDLAKKAGESLKGLGKFLPSGGVGGGNPLEALKALVGLGGVAGKPGQIQVVTPFGTPVTDFASTTPHHSYQSTTIGTARDVTLMQNGSYDVPTPSALSGIVQVAEWLGGYGNTVIVRAANGMEALMGHFKKLLVSAGQVVQFGQPIGIQGSTGRSTGEHIHIEAPTEVIDRWLKFMSGTGEFGVTQGGGKGGGDPHQHGTAIYGEGGGDPKEIFKKLKDEASKNLRELATIQKRYSNDQKAGLIEESDAKSQAAKESKPYVESLKNIKSRLEEYSVGSSGQASEARSLIERIRPKIETKAGPGLAELEAGNLEALKESIAKISDQIDLQVQTVNTDLALGLRTQAEAESAILAIREDSLAALDEQGKKLAYLGTVTEDEAIKLESAQILEQMRRYRVEIEEGKKALQNLALEEIYGRYSEAQQQLAIAQSSIQNDLLLGLLTEEAALNSLLQKRTEIGAKISQSLPDLQLFMATAADPAAVLNAQNLYEQIRQISAETEDQIRQAAEVKRSESDLTKINEQLLSIGKSAKEGIFDSLINGGKGFLGVLEDIGKQLAKLALNLVFKQILGTAASSVLGFKDGGEVPNFAGGGMVGAISQALQREGPGSVLGALTPGEQILSKDNGDAQMSRQMMSDGNWAAMKKIYGYARGGQVGSMTRTRSRSSTADRPIGISIDRINKVDYVSLDQLSSILSVRDPQVAAAGASIVERNMQSYNWRRSNGLG